MKRIVVTCAVVLGMAAPAWAQVPIIVLPSSSIQFTASPDQTTIGIDGNPLLTSYAVTYCTTATPSTCLAAINLGKPTPDANNNITVSGGLFGALVANSIYTATVVAIGPGGTSAPTAASAPFGEESAPKTPASAPAIKR